MDDALRSGVLKGKDLPQKIKDVVGERHSKRIGAMVRDLIVETLRADDGRLHVVHARAGRWPYGHDLPLFSLLFHYGRAVEDRRAF